MAPAGKRKMERDEFRRAVRAIDDEMAGKSYSRSYLAGRIGIDPKTNRRYLIEYQVGWPPFREELMYWVVIAPDTEGEFRIVEVDPNLAALIGRTPEEMIGMDSVSATGHDQVPELQQVARDVVAGRQRPPVLMLEWFEQRQTGERLWFGMTLTSQAEGRIHVHLVPVIDDGTLEELIELGAVGGDVDDLAEVLLDEQRIVRVVRSGFARRYGWTPLDLVGRPMAAVQGREPAPPHDPLLTRVIIPALEGEFGPNGTAYETWLYHGVTGERLRVVVHVRRPANGFWASFRFSDPST